MAGPSKKRFKSGGLLLLLRLHRQRRLPRELRLLLRSEKGGRGRREGTSGSFRREAVPTAATRKLSLRPPSERRGFNGFDFFFFETEKGIGILFKANLTFLSRRQRQMPQRRREVRWDLNDKGRLDGEGRGEEELARPPLPVNCFSCPIVPDDSLHLWQFNEGGVAGAAASAFVSFLLLLRFPQRNFAVPCLCGKETVPSLTRAALPPRAKEKLISEKGELRGSALSLFPDRGGKKDGLQSLLLPPSS
jgi:hypothetical protein